MILTFIVLLGLAMGSFINALVWRLHKKKDFVKERSVCEKCGHVLSWQDLIPIFSYLSLRGKCRYCKKTISVQNLIAEIVMAVAFTIAYFFWPLELTGAEDWLQFALFLGITSLLLGITIYDIKWMEIPTSLIKALWVLVIASLITSLVVSENPAGDLLKDSLLGIVIGGGIFYALYYAPQVLQRLSGKKSKPDKPPTELIGGGDVRLGFVMGAYVGALSSAIALIVAFYASAVFVLPLMAAKKLNRKSRVPFGPFLVLGFFVVSLWGADISDWLKDWLSV